MRKIYPDAEASILEAMLFGEKRELSGDIKELYQAAGISHVLVISGLHISLLALAVAGIFRRLGFPMPVWVILSVGVLAGVRYPDRTAHHSGTGFTDVFCTSGCKTSRAFLRSAVCAGVCRDSDAPG